MINVLCNIELQHIYRMALITKPLITIFDLCQLKEGRETRINSLDFMYLCAQF